MCGRCGLDRLNAQSLPPLCSATGGVHVCVIVRHSFRLLTFGLQIAVWWLRECCIGFDSKWEESRSTKPRVFPCKVAAAGGERYLVCAAGATWIVSTRNRFLLCVPQRVVVHVCVSLCNFFVAAGHRESYWSGCIKAALVICQQIYLNFGAHDFPFQSLQLDIVNRILEWLHQGCDSDLSADFLNFGADDFLFQDSFSKVVVFFCCGVEIRFWSCNF